jgi:RNA polymerase sigma factor (sigma-70 family)
MMKRERKSVSLSGDFVPGRAGRRRPDTPIEALMSAAPGDEPEQSFQESMALQDAIGAAVDGLEEQDRFVIEAVFFECVSLEELGRRLGVSKTHAWRLRNSALKKLEKLLVCSPVVLEQLGLESDEALADNGGV